MPLLIDNLAPVATGAAPWHWSVLGLVAYGYSCSYLSPFVCTMLCVLVLYALHARSTNPTLDSKDDLNLRPMEAYREELVIHGGRAKIAGTTKGHEPNPKRLYYTLHIEPSQGHAWTIDRSYKEFRNMYKALLVTGRLLGNDDTRSKKIPKFPKRSLKLFVNQTKRTEGLAKFLQYLVDDERLAKDAHVIDFLGAHSPLRKIQGDASVLPSTPTIDARHEKAEQAKLSKLTTDERTKLEQLRADMPHDQLCSRRLLLIKYISNCEWNVATAKARVSKAIEWRQTTLPVFDRAVLQNELQTGKIYVADFLDAKMNAVAIVRLHLENSFPQSNFLVNAMYTMERALLHTSPVHHCTIVIDFSQYAFKHGPEQGIFLKFVKMMEAQYLVHVDKVILFDMPWYMTKGYNLLKPFFDPVTCSKLILVKSTNLEPIRDSDDPFDVDVYLQSIHARDA
ncbi:unnamed protein product [Aphanomyces euteiches]